MYRHIDAMAKGAGAIGIRAVLSNVVADDEHGLDTLASNEPGVRSSHGAADGRLEGENGTEWLSLSSMGLLRDASALAKDLGTGVHIHLNESMGEVQSSI